MNQFDPFKPNGLINEKTLIQDELVFSTQGKTGEHDRETANRNWMDATLSRFDEILRINYDKSVESFSDIVISEISEITGAVRGAFFIVDDEKELIYATAGYACLVETMVRSQFKSGDGMIGQAVKSRKPIYLDNVPAKNAMVDSSLAQLSSTSVAIVPLIFNDRVYGVLELASLYKFQAHHTELLQRLSRNIASTLQSIHNNIRTKKLLEQMQFQAESMRAQEEELRQNLEELESTQEEMKRIMGEIQTQTNIINKVALVSRTDLHGNITYVNDEFVRWSKYTPAEVIGKNHRILKSGQQDDEIFVQLWRTIIKGQIFRGELKNKAKDGTYYWVDAVIAPVLDVNDRPKEYIAQLFIINDKKEKEEQTDRMLDEMRAQEEELRQTLEELTATQEEIQRTRIAVVESNANLHALMNSTENMMLSINRDYELLVFNQAYQDMYSPVGIQITKGMSIFELAPPDEKKKWKESFDRALNGEKYVTEDAFIDPEGNERFLSTAFTPIRDQHNRIMGVAMLCLDVTKARKHEKQLRENEATIKNLTNALPGAVFQFSAKDGLWKVDYMSSKYEMIFGYPAEDILNDINTFTTHLHPEDVESYVASVTKAIETMSTWHCEGRSFNPAGEIVWWQGYSSPSLADDGSIRFNGILLDITEQKKLMALHEEELKKNQKSRK